MNWKQRYDRDTTTLIEEQAGMLRSLAKAQGERDELQAVIKGKDVDLERAFILSSIKTTEATGLKTVCDALQRDNARLREAQFHWEKARPILIQEHETLATKRDKLERRLEEARGVLAEVWDEFPLRWKHQLGVSLASKVEAALAGGEGE